MVLERERVGERTTVLIKMTAPARREERRGEKRRKRGQEKRREEERLIELLTVQREQMLEVNGALVKERKSVS